jgi:hypothetical protein
LWCILLQSWADLQPTSLFRGIIVSPELEHIRREVERVTSAMSGDDWRYAPPGKWNCAQILEHLQLSYTATSVGAQAALQTGKPLGGQPKLRDKLATFYVARMGFLPTGRMAPKQSVPKNGSGAEPLRQFNDALVAMDAALANAEKRFGSVAKILDHPVLGPLNTKDWRRFHRTHARHHLKQVAKLLRQASSARAC